MRVSRYCLMIFMFPALLFALSCAKVSAPSGGPKDRTSPVVVESEPENGSRNFNGKRITVTFNEFVVLEKINEKFMISPPVGKKPGIFLRGKSVVVEFEEKLRDSTTYTLYFQDAIRDITEGNPINNFQFVFSTGPYIDSLSTSGNVYNSLSLDPPENTLVLMHKVLADSAPLKLLPDYISRVDVNGGFRIDNIHGGEYRLYALTDINNNKMYDPADEAFAFMDSSVVIDSVKNYKPLIVEIKDTLKTKPGVRQETTPPAFEGEYRMYLFKAEKKSSYLASSDRKFPFLLVYILSVPPDTSKVEISIPDASQNAFFKETNKTGDTIKIWLTDSSLYSRPQITTLVRYPFTDTTGTLIYKRDTVTMRFLTSRTTQARAKAKKNQYTIRTGMSGGAIKPVSNIPITSETPFRDADTSRIRLYETLTAGKTRIPFTLRKDTLNSCRYILSTTIKPGSNYLFIADSAAFGNIYGEHCDSMGIKFSVRKTETYGKIIMEVKTEEYNGNLILQILDNQDNIVANGIKTPGGSWEFAYIEKGRYRIRAIFDLNGDGKWTTGDYTKKRQPEPAAFYSDELEVKENWDLNNEWVLKPVNSKDRKLRIMKKQ